MSYFKDTFISTYQNWWSFLEDTTKMIVCRKNHVINVLKEIGKTSTIAHSNSNMPYNMQIFVANTSSGVIVKNGLADNISSGVLPDSATVAIQYGDSAFNNVDCFTFYCVLNNTAYNRTVCNWNDGTSDYTFHIFDSPTTHYASVATNNPDIAVTDTSFTFPVVKDFDIRTVANSLNGGSDKYIIQPLIAFGMKTPIFLITGANGADVPLFSEIEAGGKSYFVIGSNYCVEM